MMNKTRSFWLVLFLVAMLNGCIVAAVSAVAVTTIDVIHDRRSAGAYIDDNNIELSIRQHILRDKDLRQNTHISATSMNGIILLTGEAPSVDLKTKIGDYAKDLDGARQVVNEIQLSGKTAFGSRANDSWLTTKVKSRLLRKTKLDATRIKVVSEHGNVYLLGLVNHAEAQAATEIVRGVRGVTGVTKVFEYLD